MLEWDEYIKQLLETKCVFGSITLSSSYDSAESNIPPIIKSSILMLESIIKKQDNYNVIVFPEKTLTMFLFTMIKLIHDIYEGQIEKIYNPYSFIIGEKLKFQNCVVEFNGVCFRDGDDRVYFSIKTSDLEYSAPINIMPFFQRTDTNRNLSSWAKFCATKKKIEDRLGDKSCKFKPLAMIADHKTHLESSVYYVSPIINTRTMINEYRPSGEKISDIILIGQTNYEGRIKNIGGGQLVGIPALVLASDLYAVDTAVNKGNPMNSVIVDISSPSIVFAQLDALDNLIRSGVPITCISNTANSFDLYPLDERGFNFWKWDRNSITNSLYDNGNPNIIDEKIKNCARKKVKYITAKNSEISNSIKLLSTHKSEISTQSPKMMKIFDRLYSLILSALREVVPKAINEIKLANNIIIDCEKDLSYEKKYISQMLYDNFTSIINNLKTIYSPEFSFQKHDKFSEYLSNNNNTEICIIVPELIDEKRVQSYWQKWCTENCLNTRITAITLSEYYNMDCYGYDVTVIVGWLGEIIMQKILYSFNTAHYVVLLYDHECKWRNAHINKWIKVQNRFNQSEIIKKFFNTSKFEISLSRFKERMPYVKESPVEEANELNDLELIIRENKYIQYVSKNSPGQVERAVEAIPVHFVGGLTVLYQLQHKIITVTEIVINDGEKIEIKTPSNLKIGDFIVLREADRGIIRELADTILENSGKSKLREMAMKWKKALTIKLKVLTPEEIYEKLVVAGCKKSCPTVRGWLFDESIIAPMHKEDIALIAQIIQSKEIGENLDQIFDAAREVRRAHVYAGRILSKLLRRKIVEILQNHLDIDPFDIREPVEIQIENIGLVRILKVVDIGLEVSVDAAFTNRLIEEGDK